MIEEGNIINVMLRSIWPIPVWCALRMCNRDAMRTQKSLVQILRQRIAMIIYLFFCCWYSFHCHTYFFDRHLRDFFHSLFSLISRLIDVLREFEIHCNFQCNSYTFSQLRHHIRPSHRERERTFATEQKE